MSHVLAHIDIAEVEIRTVNGEAEISIYPKGADDPLVIYVDSAAYVENSIKNYDGAKEHE